MKFRSRGQLSLGIQHLWLIIFLLQPLSVYAHSDIHERVNALIEQIHNNPQDPSLLFKRAELNRQHQDWDAALADYDQVEKLDADFTALDFGRGRTLFEAGRAEEALVSLDRYLKHHPQHIRALLTRARANTALARYQSAIADYNMAISLAKQPLPEYYLERAQSWVAAGDEFYDKAIQGLDEGVALLGPVFTLQYAAIDLEIQKQRYSDALKRMNELPASIKNTPIWQLRRGDILQLAGRNQQAREAFDLALIQIHELPETRRKVKAIADLEKQLLIRLE